MKLACTKKDAEQNRYVPPVLGNGDLSLQIDYRGGMRQERFCDMLPGIYRAGVRYDNYYMELVPFGWFEQTVAGCGEPEDWKQTFDPELALCEMHCEYNCGIRVDTEIFCHLEHNIIAIRKRISGGGEIDSRFAYTLNSKRMNVKVSGTFRLDYAIDTIGDPSGSIFLIPAGECEAHVIDNHTYELRTSERESTFFIAFGEEEAKVAKALGYDGLFESHRAAWNAFRNDSKINVPEGRLREVCRTAEYHLRISSTKWSIPVGIYPSHWQGRYFGFDEYFAFSGLLLSGHAKEAKKVPLFRHAILPFAMKRAYTYFGKTSSFARYQWETVETPLIEGAPQGFWLEHIFHMAHIGLETRKYYDVTGDRYIYGRIQIYGTEIPGQNEDDVPRYEYSYYLRYAKDGVEQKIGPFKKRRPGRYQPKLTGPLIQPGPDRLVRGHPLSGLRFPGLHFPGLRLFPALHRFQTGAGRSPPAPPPQRPRR